MRHPADFDPLMYVDPDDGQPVHLSDRASRPDRHALERRIAERFTAATGVDDVGTWRDEVWRMHTGEPRYWLAVVADDSPLVVPPWRDIDTIGFHDGTPVRHLPAPPADDLIGEVWQLAGATYWLQSFDPTRHLLWVTDDVDVDALMPLLEVACGPQAADVSHNGSR